MKPLWQPVLLALILSLSCFGLTQYWYGSSSTESNQNENESKPLAYLKNHENEVLSRPSKKLVWYPVENHREFSKGDSIRTGSTANAEITIYALGRSIELAANSLIVIEEAQNDITLNILEGQVVVRPSTTKAEDSKQLFISKGKESFNLSKGSAKVTAKDQSLKLEVLSGTAQVGTTSETLSRGQIVEATQNGKVTKQKRPIELISPLPLAEYLSDQPKELIDFEWNNSENHNLRLYLGPTEDQLKGYALPKNKAAQKASLKLSEGQYYWKIQALAQESNQIVYDSPIHRFTIKRQIPPTPVLPKDNAQLSSQQKNLVFAWVTDPHFKKNLLQIASDKAFKQNEQRIPIEPRGHHKIENLKPGTYYWRVISYPPKGASRFSPSFSFQVVDGEVEEPKIVSQAPVEPPTPVVEPKPAPAPPQAAAPAPPTPPAPTEREVATAEATKAKLKEKEKMEEEAYQRLKAPKFKSIEVK